MASTSPLSSSFSNLGPAAEPAPASSKTFRQLIEGIEKDNAAIRSTTLTQMQVLQEVLALKGRLLQKKKKLTQMYAQVCVSSRIRGARLQENQAHHFFPWVAENVSTSLGQQEQELTAYAERLLLQEQSFVPYVDSDAWLTALRGALPLQGNPYVGADQAMRHAAFREHHAMQENVYIGPDEASVPAPQWLQTGNQHGLRTLTPRTSSGAPSLSLRREASRPSEGIIARLEPAPEFKVGLDDDYVVGLMQV